MANFIIDQFVTFDKSFKRHWYIYVYGYSTYCYVQKRLIFSTERTYVSRVIFGTRVIYEYVINRLLVIVENYLVLSSYGIKLARVTYINFILRSFNSWKLIITIEYFAGIMLKWRDILEKRYSLFLFLEK
jgi:hypothetical protein